MSTGGVDEPVSAGGGVGDAGGVVVLVVVLVSVGGVLVPESAGAGVGAGAGAGGVTPPLFPTLVPPLGGGVESAAAAVPDCPTWPT